MHKTYRPVASSLATVHTLRVFFGEELFLLQQNPPGMTEFSVVVNHRYYLQNLRVPPDSRQYPSSFSLHQFPFFIHFEFIHGGNQYKPHRNGTIVDLFVGPPRGASAAWDCRSLFAYRLWFQTNKFRAISS